MEDLLFHETIISKNLKKTFIKLNIQEEKNRHHRYSSGRHCHHNRYIRQRNYYIKNEATKRIVQY